MEGFQQAIEAISGACRHDDVNVRRQPLGDQERRILARFLGQFVQPVEDHNEATRSCGGSGEQILERLGQFRNGLWKGPSDPIPGTSWAISDRSTKRTSDRPPVRLIKWCGQPRDLIK